MEKEIKPFNQVNFEIVGKCNAKCTYCVTGNGTQTGDFVDLEEFKESIQLLYNKNLVDKNTIFHLYNWGEPLLHPNFSKIIEFMSESEINFSLSTNLSVIPKNITPESFSNLNSITISMPGFSQNSYNKIHGFNFYKF